MIKMKHILATTVAALASLSVGQSASASQSDKTWVTRTVQTPVYTQQAQLQRWAQNRISYAQAKSIAMRRHPGATYLDMSLNGNTYNVRLLLRTGQRVTVYVDASTGRVR